MIHHIHLCQCIALILVKKVQSFYQTRLTIVIHNAPLPMHVEEVHSSPITKKVPSERHSVVQEEDPPSSYNIEEIFSAFTFSLHRNEFSQKRVRKVKQDDGT